MFVIFFLIFNQSFFNPFYFGNEKEDFLFKKKFFTSLASTKVFFSLRNDFLLGIEGKEKRGLYHFSPERFYLFIPFFKNYQIGFQLTEFINQDYDIYYQPENFKKEDYFWHIKSIGGIYNSGLIFINSFKNFSFFLDGNYNLGNNWEIFSVVKEKNILSAETLTYNYSGGNCRLGLIFQNEKFSLEVNFSPLRRITSQMVIKNNRFKKDYSFKPVLTFLGTIFLKDDFKLSYFYTYQFDTLIFPEKNGFGFSFDFSFYNYFNKLIFNLFLSKVREVGFSYLWELPIKNYGKFYPELKLSYHWQGNLSEIIYTCKLNFLFEEIWKRRIRKWGS
jgi:hypothetical protein